MSGNHKRKLKKFYVELYMERCRLLVRLLKLLNINAAQRCMGYDFATRMHHKRKKQ
jgi:hypothetical protein